MSKVTFVSVLGAITLATALMLPTIASATKVVSISGTVSRERLKKDCAGVGGSYSSTAYGYGCTKGQNFVNCVKGKCTGYIPRQVPSHTLSGVLHAPGVKTTGRVSPPRHGVRPVKVGGAKARHLRYGRVVKTSGLKTKTMYRRSTGPTNPNGPDIPGKDKGPFTTPEHHSGRHR